MFSSWNEVQKESEYKLLTEAEIIRAVTVRQQRALAGLAGGVSESAP